MSSSFATQALSRTAKWARAETVTDGKVYRNCWHVFLQPALHLPQPHCLGHRNGWLEFYAFMLHRPGNDGSAGLDDKIRWSECLPGSLGKAAVNSTQLWSANDNPTPAFTSLFTSANDKWINLSFRTRHSLQNNVGWELGWIRGGLRQLRSVLWWDKTSPKESS